MRARWGIAATVLLAAAAPRAARGADVGQVGGSRVALDVTETSVVAQRFADARGNALLQDSGWGQWINRVDAALRWGSWTAGLRLDSAVYFLRPIDQPAVTGSPGGPTDRIAVDNESRFENSIYPAKVWLSYAAPGVEVTAGDAYVQFGRGLTLSMRKIDELGIDTTLRGLKLAVQKDPFAITAVAGFGNPSRVDEASGRSLFPTHDPVLGDPPLAVFGSDRIFGVELQAGRGMPVTLATRAVHFERCAPYSYDPSGGIVNDLSSDPGPVAFGTCDGAATAAWLQQIGNIPTSLGAREITMVGQSLEIPSLSGHGKVYLEAAAQERRHDVAALDKNGAGNALYAALSADTGHVTATLEVKSNRNFFTVPASVDPTRAGEFSVVAYSFLPPAETFNMIDTEGTGNFNACVDGGRLRVDVNATDALLVYGQGVYADTKSEDASGACDALGRPLDPARAGHTRDKVWDGIGGFEWYYQDARSHLFGWFGGRDDTRADGQWAYREGHVEYDWSQFLSGPFSIEVQGRHRHRREENQNGGAYWTEGENYVAFKWAPRWVVTQGFEYTTIAGPAPLYLNGALLYKFTSSSNVRVFVGQQRGAFRCASGICRYFPPFEGARAELTLRF